jgi:hypothetical protein
LSDDPSNAPQELCYFINPILAKKSKNKGITAMNKGLISKAEVTINSSLSKVWGALINPETIKQYMFGTEVVSD